MENTESKVRLVDLYCDVQEPEPKKRKTNHDPKYIGLTGLSKFEFIATLLQENEIIPQPERWTMGRIMAAINKDFEKEKGDYGYMNLTKLSQRQTKYNRGELIATWPKPNLISLRYNRNGVPLCPQHSAKPAGIHDLRKLAKKYRIADPRLLKPEEIEELKKRQSMNLDFAAWHIPPQEVIEEFPFNSLELTGFNGGRFSNLFT